MDEYPPRSAVEPIVDPLRRPDPVLVGVPVKPFGAAKGRLATHLDPAARRALGSACAQRVIEAAGRAGAAVIVVAGDAEVADWAVGRGAATLQDPGTGLDGAAAAVVEAAAGQPWLVCHADLPMITAADLTAVVGLVGAGRAAIAPSWDGGTSAIGGTSPGFRFGYGPGSFRRHLCAAGDAVIVVRTGLAWDLDTAEDLAMMAATPRGAWLAPLAAAAPAGNRW